MQKIKSPSRHSRSSNFYEQKKTATKIRHAATGNTCLVGASLDIIGLNEYDDAAIPSIR